MTGRILFHVQHLLGSGHLRRAAAIAAALVRHGCSVELVSGGMSLPDIDCGGARFVQLPPARAADETFRTLLDDAGRAVDDAWRAARRKLLLARFDAFKPDVIVTELFPLGRRAFAFELVPLLEAARRRQPRPLILASVRDVIAAKTDEARLREMVGRVYDFYDRILVHGDPEFIPLGASFPEDRIRDRVTYTGYVAGGTSQTPPPADGEEEIVVSVGGGAVGDRLLRTALAARPLSAERDRTWRLLIGPNLPSGATAELLGASGPGCIVEPARADFPGLLGRCHVSISQAGYNTVMDVLTARTRAVLIPFAAAGETEQTVRAAAMARRGWAVVAEERTLTPAGLAAAVDRASRYAKPEPGSLRRNGAEESARLIGHWLAQRSISG